MKLYTFAEVARRECAECTTTITTTRVDHYILAADFDRLREGSRERVADMLGEWKHGHAWKSASAREDQWNMADRIVAAIFDEKSP